MVGGDFIMDIPEAAADSAAVDLVDLVVDFPVAEDLEGRGDTY